MLTEKALKSLGLLNQVSVKTLRRLRRKRRLESKAIGEKYPTGAGKRKGDRCYNNTKHYPILLHIYYNIII